MIARDSNAKPPPGFTAEQWKRICEETERQRAETELYETRQRGTGPGRSEAASYSSLARNGGVRELTLCSCGRVSQREDEPCARCEEGGR